MKPIFSVIICLSLAVQCFSQSFILPVYMHDAVGNSDTVLVSGDLTASTLLDANFGEVNLNGLPYDSVFEARLTYDVFSATRIETKKQALYYECPLLWRGYTQPNHLLIRCKNWPLTIKWNKDSVNSNELCINLTAISNDLSFLGGSVPPQYYLSSRDSVLYSANQLTTPYNISLNNGQSAPLYVIAIGISDDGTVGMNDIGKQEISVWPNPTTNLLHLKGIEATSYKFSIHDVSGQLLYEKMVIDGNVVDVSSFDAGFYIATVATNNNVQTFKWSKQ